MSKILIGVYWTARADDLQSCTDRAAAHFRLLHQLGPGFDRWFKKAMRKPKAPSEANVLTPEVVGDLLAKGVNRRDTDKSVITELGWSLALWNGELNQVDAQTSLHCGCISDRVGNSAIVDAHREGRPGLDHKTAVELLKSLVELWDPESGAVVESIWNEDRQTREVAEIASYQSRSGLVPLSTNALQLGKGILNVNG